MKVVRFQCRRVKGPVERRFQVSDRRWCDMPCFAGAFGGQAFRTVSTRGKGTHDGNLARQSPIELPMSVRSVLPSVLPIGLRRSRPCKRTSKRASLTQIPPSSAEDEARRSRQAPLEWVSDEDAPWG